MIEIQDLQKSFGNFRAVDGVSFSVEPGEVLGFLGPNGAGKSTTMRMITGFLTPTSGEVRVAGTSVMLDPVAAKRRIGYLPEGAPLYPDMTPRTLLEFIAEIRGIPASERKARIDTVVAQIHISEVLDQRIETLSKGFKRRVGLAQAILHDPEILILDEPTDGLDPNQKHEVRQLIQEIAGSLKEEGLLDPDTEFETVDHILTGLEDASGRVADAVNTPPLDVAGLRKEWHEIQTRVRKIPLSRLPTAERLWDGWRGLRAEATAQEQDGLGEDLHDPVLDAVVGHLHEVPGRPLAAPGHAVPVLAGRRHRLQERPKAPQDGLQRQLFGRSHIVVGDRDVVAFPDHGRKREAYDLGPHGLLVGRFQVNGEPARFFETVNEGGQVLLGQDGDVVFLRRRFRGRAPEDVIGQPSELARMRG